MAKSKRLTAADLQSLVRILGECRELGDDPGIWRHHFFAAVAKLIDADLSSGGEVTGCLAGRVASPGTALWGFDHGFDLDGLRILWEWNAVDPDYSQLWVRFRDRLRAAPAGATAARYQVFSDSPWERSPDYQQVMRTLGADAVMHSFYQLPSGGDFFEGGCWFRARGRSEFDEHEVALVTLLHKEAARLIGGPLARFDEPRPSQLPPRVRQTLRCLLEGDSDKQIAARLTISTHTVNQYAKQLYRHFGVSGRHELLARWVRRGWSIHAAWDVQDVEHAVYYPMADY
jgi:DNA-binding CsgD family transcriptional regulator